MKRFAETFGVALCGLVTSILVALADVAIARMVGLDPFTYSIWFVVPAGAIGMGVAAASGYYFGSLYFEQRAGKGLLLQMVLIAGFTQILIYWFGYTTMTLDDGRNVADLVPFTQYLDIVLTSSDVIIDKGGKVGPVGAFGYWLAAFQFVGFLAGGLLVYVYLQAKAICPS